MRRMASTSFAALAPWLGIGLVFVLAGGVKGVTGMGLPTVAMSLLGLWMAPAQAAALLVMPSLVTNIAQCQGPAWRRIVATLSLAARLHSFESGSVLSVSSLVALAAAFAGLGVGAAVRARISPTTFQRALFVVFIVLGLANLWRGL